MRAALSDTREHARCSLAPGSRTMRGFIELTARRNAPPASAIALVRPVRAAARLLGGCQPSSLAF
jgi:hypothetical protein